MSRVYAVDAIHELPFTRPGAIGTIAGPTRWVFIMTNGAFAPGEYQTFGTGALADLDLVLMRQAP
jgi:hypothetical protein